ncbi:hypothetical protein PVAND_015667 [Polypedilum vanderplanki]|uniref:Cation-transporting P-type ATPase C-terminal domain-containing protein n=1 Tax=Polypedilum vanderplanki TaxID=319348 RepID=A0A9J6BDN2_POLVA|nr:hypothetical protein PVAND_015667 [Polypedilum vanderplanki]
MNIEKNAELGLSTQDALKKLHDDIKKVVDEEYANLKRKKLGKHQNYRILTNYSIFITLLLIIGLFITSYFCTAIVVFLILVFNVYFVYREEKLRSTEMIRKTEELLNDIELSIILSKDWKNTNYPHLISPLSPCITLCWCYRDNELRNLPTALLVEGDIIVLRVGQISPANCHEITGKNSKAKSFKIGETYGHKSQYSENEAPKKPIAVQPLPDLICIVEHTPFIENLKLCFEKFLDRPPTFHNHQRNTLINIYLQKYVFILVLIIVIATINLRAFDSYFIRGKIMHKSWTNIGILNCVSSLMSLSPLIFPLLWINLHHWGSARLNTLLSIPQPLMQIEKTKSSPEMMDTPTSDLDMPIIPRKQVFCNYLRILKGSCDLLSRSTNIIQILGSVSAFCCVDKKGILSWPNPTPEKVFFLRDANIENTNSKNSSDSSLNSNLSDQNEKETVAEVLDLTHDQNSPFKLEFDDHEWKNHLNSLKPLGLAILVNTCCEKTQFSYSKFCSHIAAASIVDKNLVPVTNRRCLCELARQIGFTAQAKSIFNFEGQISSFRHLQPEVIRRDTRFAKSLHLASKIKIPFPHSLSVVIKQIHGGSLQLLSQGTADIILDFCDDFWNGKDLRPLREEERKRAQDFYQRNALTAYCTAFSYRPLRQGIVGMLAGPGPLGTSDLSSCQIVSSCDVRYLELPPETFERSKHAEKNHCDFEGHSLSHSISSDSLLFSDIKEEPVQDIEGCYEMQSHQIFIGMVTMQYQAQTDIVQLIERFEKACIRFVHFSKENELRSRVFSEKMGLESGWNCHISLLETEKNEHNSSPKQKIETNEEHKEPADEFSRLLPQSNFESTKLLSSSAPCAISEPDSKQQDDKIESRNSSISNHDSVMEGLQEIQSISITTDSSEQSNQIPIYISNRAKLPRGIDQIEPHIQNVDNVPLLVSLFTDCLPEATKEMLKIMQKHGEVCIVMGSSANSHSNCQIFLQANCSIGCEPLYPQVCQNVPAYTESNLYNNKEKYLKDQPKKWYDIQKPVTISPIYLSRMLNSLPCSISLCRDDPISILGLIELARKFSIGLWNCIQFYASTAIMFSILNMLSCAMSLPPILTPDLSLYLMCCITAPLAISLVRIEYDPNIMNRASGKKTKFRVDFHTFFYILWCYGAKYIASIIILIIIYLFTVDHIVFDLVAKDDENFSEDMLLARNFILFGVVLHLIVISSSFVHRDYSIWKKNPLSNSCWVLTSSIILILHLILFICQIVFNNYSLNEMNDKWPALVILIVSIFFIASVAELCKYYEIKNENRARRRARLDFGTKLGMNSPF